MRRTAIGLGIGLLLVMGGGAAAGCGDDDGEVRGLLIADVARNTADESAIEGAIAANDAFAFELYAVMAREEGNLAISPYSAVVALAMTRTGAAGETLAQMEGVLHTDVAGDLDAGLNAIGLALEERPGEYEWGDGKVELELTMANQLFGQDGYEFHDAFLERLAADYGAGMRLVDYRTATEAARKTINEWVADRTRDRIPELIPVGILNDMTRLVLTNAIHLKAPWLHRFDASDTAPGDFHRLDGSTVETQLMHLSQKLAYAEGPGYQAVELPYVDRSLAMLVIVPEDGRFSEVESSFDAEELAAMLESLSTAQVTLTLPKFEFRTQAKLKDALSEMGMPIAFDEIEADFSGMGPQGADLFIRDVLQEVFIAVDEDGTEAAAATAVIMEDESAAMPATVVADSPFLFLIRDMETGATLFMGRVVDPTA